MKSNFQMLRDFRTFKPKHFGWLDGNEVTRIQRHFKLKERSDVGLQNLRDFVVLYFANKERSDLTSADIMSGIVGVIDQEKYERGLEV